MKELDEYIYKNYGDEYDEELCALEIEGIKASFLAGHNVLRDKILIKIAELEREREIKPLNLQLSPSLKKHLEFQEWFLKELLNEKPSH